MQQIKIGIFIDDSVSSVVDDNIVMYEKRQSE